MNSHSNHHRRNTRQENGSGITHPRVGRLSDRHISAAAKEAIRVLPTVPKEAVKVTAHDGWIHLEGKLSGRHQRTILEDVIRFLPGVRGVSDCIVIEAVLH